MREERVYQRETANIDLGRNLGNWNYMTANMRRALGCCATVFSALCENELSSFDESYSGTVRYLLRQRQAPLLTGFMPSSFRVARVAVGSCPLYSYH